MNKSTHVELNLDPHELNACVQCGLCLSSCPTYRTTGDEAYSPRGRIALMRMAQDDGFELDADMVEAFTSCIQCRACEPACPSGVRYGHLIEATNEALASSGLRTPWWQKLGLWSIKRPRVLRLLTFFGILASQVGLAPRRIGLPDGLPLTNPKLETSGEDVYLFTGCVMDAWQRPVHQATLRALKAFGIEATPTSSVDTVGCCGALDQHAGLTATARRSAEHVIQSLGGSTPVLVNSAGCGAAMKEYGRLVGTPEAQSFANKVFDVQEFLAARSSAARNAMILPIRVAIQDPCHLRNVQRVHTATRTLLEPYVSDLVELDDEGLCCGAGGAYSLTHPELSSELGHLKLQSIARAAPDVVASANPGCSMHLASGPVSVVHPMEIVDQALSGRGSLTGATQEEPT